MSYDKEIQDYLEGRLSPEEEEEFRKRLSADRMLKRLYEEYLTLNRHLRDYYKRKKVKDEGPGEGEDLARESIAEYEKEGQKKESAPEMDRFNQRLRLIEKDFHSVYSRRVDRQRRRFIYWMAAALVVAIIGSYLLVFSHEDPGKRMFTQNYDGFSPGDFEHSRVRGDRNVRFLELYRNEEYGEMITLFEAFGTNSRFVRYLTAHAFIAEEKYESAKLLLDSMPEGSDMLQPHIYWNLALLELRDGDWERAAFHLEKLVRTGGPYAARARNLLRKVKRQID